MKSLLVWIEIPAKHFHKTVRFYEQVLNTQLELNDNLEQLIAAFNLNDHGFKGCIIHSPENKGSNGIKPIFYVPVMHVAIEKVNQLGGSIISPPEILKQVNRFGDNIIGGNLIDNKVGYLSEIKDCDGNHLFLYSHS